ncbi:hypothetical protein Dda_4223 [Drechslerella dactyloides]|uniref:Uncharacterized protein n=1 Tax=Drechslerella dactyloides TaxID=74499 RepID=A0AAD6IZC3_DREDA|nr:hypothetical protein Dda_4223 [Drechslerella dactyloides]
MKFAKQLEDNLVPEWRLKYLDYKGAKKKLKTVRRAIRNAENTSATTLGLPSPDVAAGIAQRIRTGSVSRSAATSLRQHLSPTGERKGSIPPRRASEALSPTSTTPTSNFPPPSPGAGNLTPGKHVQRVVTIPEEAAEDELDIQKSPTPPRGSVSSGDNANGDAGERQYLNPSPSLGSSVSPGYGSIPPSVSSPPIHPASTTAVPERPSLPPMLDLPGPARPLEDRPSIMRRVHTYDSSLSSHISASRVERAASVGDDPSKLAEDVPDRMLHPSYTQYSTAGRSSPRKSIFGNLRSRIGTSRRQPHPQIRNAQIYVDMTEDAQKQFFEFLAAQLKKINEFYESKEGEAEDRLARIEQQISIMLRNRLIEKERERQAAAQEEPVPPIDWKHPKDIVAGTVMHVRKSIISLERTGAVKLPSRLTPSLSTSPTDPMSHPAIAKLTTTALEAAAGPAYSPTQPAATTLEDYTRHVHHEHVRYKTAKRKLKLALVEYYHSLELLKSYSLLNREAFRKILKKFDKTAHTHIASKYLEEKVHPTPFASSEQIDRLLTRTEDLFATHYEKGRRKHAVERLRTREPKKSATGPVFRAGWYIGMGLPLLIQALYEAYHRGKDKYGMRHESQVSYLLQIWAGFAFPTLFLLLFTLCCRAWIEARINYVFIFEFDTRNNLNWRQLMELPAMFTFVQILLMWFCFTPFWGTGFDRIWFPLIYLCFVIAVLFCPFKIWYYHSRKWLLYTFYRLIWAGFYPVEFRDFWSGDIFCSMTYTMGTIPLFFCLWSKDWDTPSQCNSSHSRLLGFFTTLPSIWRLLQCLRRYYDTRNAFPHLANGMKYSAGILFYMTLSMWRMDQSNKAMEAIFILFAAINALYTSTWDLVMDWSLMNWYAPHRLLRADLAYSRPIVYYLAMIIDPIVRFNWIFYVIFAKQVQHSALLSFIVSLAELGRRFVWCFFRMENEHCANVGKFRAYKDDVPLPYDVPGPQPSRAGTTANSTTASSPVFSFAPRPTVVEARVDEEIAAVSGERPTTAHRRAKSGGGVPAGGRTSQESLAAERTPLVRAFTALTTAHAQDFERKRRPSAPLVVPQADPAVLGGSAPGRLRGYLPGSLDGYDYDEDDDDDDYDTESDPEDIRSYGATRHAGAATGTGLGVPIHITRSRGRRRSLADDAVEDLAGLRSNLRRVRIEDPGAASGSADGSGSGAAGPAHRGTGGPLEPPSPGEGMSRSYERRDYGRRSNESGRQ